MSTLASAIDEYAGADLDAFPDAALAADLTDLRVAVDRLGAQWLRRLAASTPGVPPLPTAPCPPRPGCARPAGWRPAPPGSGWW